MSKVMLSFALAVGLCALRGAHGAEVTWSTSPGLSDAEISTVGTQVMGYYFNSDTARPAVETVNGVPFTLHSTATAPAGLNFNGSYNNPENIDGYQVTPSAANDGLNRILDGQIEPGRPVHPH